MWMGWNHPPALFCSSQVSTALGAGLAITLVNREASTSAQVRPLIVHSPFWRSKTSFRVFVLSAGVSFMAGPMGKVAGSVLLALLVASAATWKAITLSVLAKGMSLGSGRLRSSIR